MFSSKNGADVAGAASRSESSHQSDDSESVVPSLEAWDQAMSDHNPGHEAAAPSADPLTFNPWSAPTATHGESAVQSGFDQGGRMEEGQAGTSHSLPTNTNGLEGQQSTGRTWGQFFADHAKVGDNFDKSIKPITVPLQAVGITAGLAYVGYHVFSSKGEL